jgi:hypothetical protein
LHDNLGASASAPSSLEPSSGETSDGSEFLHQSTEQASRWPSPLPPAVAVAARAPAWPPPNQYVDSIIQDAALILLRFKRGHVSAPVSSLGY